MPNVLSIFSGGGGIDCGFKKAGFTICFSTDFWKPACDTLEKNKVGKLVLCDDIRNVNYAEELSKIGLTLSDIDVLVGGHRALRTQNPGFTVQTWQERWMIKIPLRSTNIFVR